MEKLPIELTVDQLQSALTHLGAAAFWAGEGDPPPESAGTLLGRLQAVVDYGVFTAILSSDDPDQLARFMLGQLSATQDEPIVNGVAACGGNWHLAQLARLDITARMIRDGLKSSQMSDALTSTLYAAVQLLGFLTQARYGAADEPSLTNTLTESVKALAHAQEQLAAATAVVDAERARHGL